MHVPETMSDSDALDGSSTVYLPTYSGTPFWKLVFVCLTYECVLYNLPQVRLSLREHKALTATFEILHSFQCKLDMN